MPKISNTNCCVHGCHSRKGKGLNVSFHSFPRSGERTIEIIDKRSILRWVDAKALWMKQIRYHGEVSNHMRVCSLHFKRDDYVLPDVPTKRRRLTKDAFPTENLPTTRSTCCFCTSPPRKYVGGLNTPKTKINSRNLMQDTQSRYNCKELETAKILLEVGTNIKIEILKNSAEICEPVRNLINTSGKLNSLTGLPTLKLLDELVEKYNAIYSNKKIFNLTTIDRILLTFIKLKSNLPFAAISALFNDIDKTVCKNVFSETVDKLFDMLQSEIPWPSRDEVMKNVPEFLEDFTQIRIILNLIKIPKKHRCICFKLKSYHKSIKFLLGYTPAGLITFVSRPFTGKNTDESVFLKSEIINLLSKNEDTILVKKGFKIETITEQYGIKLIRLPSFEHKTLLTKKEYHLNKKILRTKIHIDKVLIKVKKFKIFNSSVSSFIYPQIYKICKIVCAIVNMSYND